MLQGAFIEAQASIVKALSSFAGKGVRLESYSLDLEAQVLGVEIANALMSAHIDVDRALSRRASDENIYFGVHVAGNNEGLKNSLADALFAIGIKTEEDNVPLMRGMQFTYQPPLFKPDAFIFIGVKPIAKQNPN